MADTTTALGIDLDRASQIAAAAIATARDQSMSAISVVVVDRAGTIKAAQTQDGASLMRFDIAHAKAWGAIAMGYPGRAQAGFAQNMPQLYQSFVTLAGGKLVPAPGGVFILEGGRLLGAVGVSGDTPPNDEVCALAGIEAAGLAAGTGGQ